VAVDFQSVYLELVDSTGMIRSLLAGITEEDARAKPTTDSWSILELVCHLYDEERYDFRTRLGIILSQKNEKWPPIDPQTWVTQRRYNEQSFRDVRDKFFGERSNSLDWLKGLEKADWTSLYTGDFTKMSAGDMLVSWVAHDNLAVRQLVELRRSRFERISKPFDITYAGPW
jgi:hypothetical protein